MRRQVAADLSADPYLAYILLLSAVLSGFWFWHGVPNVATRDERWRIVDPIEAVGFVLEDPGLASLREGVTFWRSYGATFYLFGAAVLPVVVAILVADRPAVLTDIATHQPRGYWDYWNSVPAWVWTVIVSLGRLTNVLFAVGCVYVLYRTGAVLRDRATGRLGALLLTLTWGFLVLAHEVGEDIPALFFFLLTVYFALRYVETGTRAQFYRGCACGGIAIALKPTAGVGAILIGIAYLLRARRDGVPLAKAVTRGRLPRVGIALGVVVILLGHPETLVGAPEEFVARIGYGVLNKTDPHYWVIAPSWWWIARGYLHGFGLPLFLGVVGGAVASPWHRRDRSVSGAGLLLALTGVATYLAVFSLWSYVRMHHLLPTVPLLLLLLSTGLARLYDRRPSVARVVVVGLVVTSSVYAGVGVLGYASQPRGDAAGWLSTHAPANATVETYINDPQDAAVPHGMAVSHVADRRMTIDGETRTPWIPAWTLAMPHRCPEYIQLNYQGGIRHLTPENYSSRFRAPDDPRLREYYRDLLAGGTYPYRVAGEFGPRPRFLESKDARSPLGELLHVGVVPRSIQYGDPQDFGVNQYTVILERTGECQPRTNRSQTGLTPSLPPVNGVAFRAGAL